MTDNTDLIAGRYRLLAQIGTGGMGVVWRARDEVLGRTVAVKELMVRSAISGFGGGLADESTQRAMREARIAARLHHPNVIGVYDIVEHESRPFLVMEFLESRSLAQLMATGVLLPPEEVARIGAQLASGLKSAHDAGIVHRDVKPGNVLLAEDGEVKLTDFGISRAVGDTTVTASGVLLGTLGYIAPEVAQGQPSDSRSDVYALGATLYAAVEGQPPFGSTENAVAMLYRIVHEDLIPARHAGPLEPVLLWMLNRDPDLRPTMPQAERALKAVETGTAQPRAA
ncbi:serine/threonine-protein kinase, partial [Actinocrinis sp.]|uniref:serine/threonine-protein kinase n=1 Tax=Actinocrinis sp. TaxID=1920516 RepID=UPI002B663909